MPCQLECRFIAGTWVCMRANGEPAGSAWVIAHAVPGYNARTELT
jgi:hypothetical protein